MQSVCNVCGVAYTVDKELYMDYLGRVTRYTSSPLIIFSATGPLRERELWCIRRFNVIQGVRETPSGVCMRVVMQLMHSVHARFLLSLHVCGVCVNLKTKTG